MTTPRMIAFVVTLVSVLISTFISGIFIINDWINKNKK